MKTICCSLALVTALGGFNVSKGQARLNLLHSEKSSTDLAQPFFRTGFYAGGFIGNSRLTTKIANAYDSSPILNTNPINYNNFEKSNNALEIGGTIGWNYAFSKKVLVGISVAVARAKNNIDVSFKPNADFDSDYLRIKVDKALTITPALSLNYNFRNNMSIYGKLGISIADFKTQLNHENSLANPPAGSLTHHSVKSKEYGFSPSIGFEYAFTSKLSLIAEGNYEIYRKKSLNFRSITSLIAPDRNDIKVNNQVFNFRLGAIYKF